MFVIDALKYCKVENVILKLSPLYLFLNQKFY